MPIVQILNTAADVAVLLGAGWWVYWSVRMLRIFAERQAPKDEPYLTPCFTSTIKAADPPERLEVGDTVRLPTGTFKVLSIDRYHVCNGGRMLTLEEK